MRQQIREARGLTIIDDSYNASPDSMRSSLGVLAGKEMPKKTVFSGELIRRGTTR